MMKRRAVLMSGGGWLWGQAAELPVPKHACDCHTHIFGDVKSYPMWEGRSYTPPAALPAEMAELHRKLGVERVVIVTPSVYGTDNAATRLGLRERKGTARGIAVIDEKVSEAELKAMGREGVCGIRLNLATGAEVGVEAARGLLEKAFDRVAGRGWHVQVFTNLAVLEAVEAMVMKAPVPLVVDHVAGARPERGVVQPGFAALLRMLRAGKAYVKVTNRFLPSGTAADLSDVKAMALSLLDANAERVVWGTDWPHPDSDPKAGRQATDLSPALVVDDRAWLQRLMGWLGKEKLVEKVLVENPARLYGF